jgi:hypothetical protein
MKVIWAEWTTVFQSSQPPHFQRIIYLIGPDKMRFAYSAQNGKTMLSHTLIDQRFVSYWNKIEEPD